MHPTYITLLIVVAVGKVTPIARYEPVPEVVQVRVRLVPLSLMRKISFVPFVGEPVVDALNVSAPARAVQTYWSYREGSTAIEVSDAAL